MKTGSLAAAFAILFFPVTFLGMYSPFGIRLLLRSAQSSGRVSGTVYGISTARQHRRHARHDVLPDSVDRHARDHAHARRRRHPVRPRADRAAALRRSAALALARAARLLSAPEARANDLVDATIRADMLKRPDGRVAHIETEYNDIFITKRRNELTMSFQLKGYDYTESIANLRDPDDLPVRYTQVMTVGVLYPPELEARADDRARRRLDLELSRPLHARRRRSTRWRSTPA